MQPIGAHGDDFMYCVCVCFRGKHGFMNCDDICMCVVNKQFVCNSVHVDLRNDKISLTSTDGSVCLYGVCSHLVVLGLSVRLSWYPVWMR